MFAYTLWDLKLKSLSLRLIGAVFAYTLWDLKLGVADATSPTYGVCIYPMGFETIDATAVVPPVSVCIYPMGFETIDATAVVPPVSVCIYPMGFETFFLLLRPSSLFRCLHIPYGI